MSQGASGDFVEYVGPPMLARYNGPNFEVVPAPAPGFLARVDGEAGLCHCGQSSLLIIHLEGWDPAWCVRLWQPVLRPKAEVLASLLAPAPTEPAERERVREPA
ncbi:MAG TPA: hypothetical protein VG248_17430 [Caulobacteraceae bacterium]|jgi:hypothetical protein|nr:hypothetical protein [Caulobacteraceae bacterium]